MRFRWFCYAEFAAMIPLAGSAYTSRTHSREFFAWIIGWDLTLEYAMGASTVPPLVQSFHRAADIFHIKNAVVLAYDHWTGLKHGDEIIGPAKGSGGRMPHCNPARKHSRQSRCHHESAGPRSWRSKPYPAQCADRFGYEIGFNLPAFVIALVITDTGIGIKESVRLTLLSCIKVAVVCL